MFKHRRSPKFLHNSGPYSFIYGFIFIGALLMLYGFMYVVDDMLPSALTVAQEKIHNKRFIAERAETDLKELVEIGPRVTGSYENEILAVNFFKKKISQIQKEADKSKIIESDHQIVSNFSLHGNYIDIYQNIQNMVVKLHAEKQACYSVLVNAHFDTVENSPGGSDNGINCVVALEVLRKLSKTLDRFKHNIIFLFNGAGEQGLLGAYGFMTQHKWAKEVKAVINLDSAGSGGKALLIQTGSKQPWLLKYYSKVKQPFGQVLIEEIYQQGLLSLHTDYYRLTEFNDVTGYDFAFINEHYKQHSKFDDFDSIPLGSYQHIGDITLDLTEYLANASEINDYNKPSTNYVFYDVWGAYFIYYTNTNAIIINVVTAIFSFAIIVPSFYHFRLEFSRKYVKYFTIALFSILCGWVVSLVYLLVVASFLNAIGFSMSWNNNSCIIIGLYVLSLIGIACGVTFLFSYCRIKEVSVERHTQILIHLQRLLWTVCLLIGTGVGVRSVYLIEISIFCQTFCFVIVHLAFLYRSGKDHSSVHNELIFLEKTWLFIYFFTTVVSTTLLMKYSFLLGYIFSVLSKLERNTEIYVALATWSLTILITSAYIPLINLIKKGFILIFALLGVHLVFLVIVFTPLGNPYSSDPKSPIQSPFKFNLSITKQHGINHEVVAKNISLKIIRKSRNEWKFENVTELNLENMTDLVSSDSLFTIKLNKTKFESQISYNFSFNLQRNAILSFNAEEGSYINEIHLPESQSIEYNKTSYSTKYLRGVESSLNLHLTINVSKNWNKSALILQISTYYTYNVSKVSFPYYKKFFDYYTNKTDSISVNVTEKWIF